MGNDPLPPRIVRQGYEAYRARIYPHITGWAYEVYGPMATYREDGFGSREQAERYALRFIEGHINGETVKGTELAERVDGNRKAKEARNA